MPNRFEPGYLFFRTEPNRTRGPPTLLLLLLILLGRGVVVLLLLLLVAEHGEVRIGRLLLRAQTLTPKPLTLIPKP